MLRLAVVLMKSFGDSIKGKTDKAKNYKRILMYALITVAMLPTAGMIGAAAYGSALALNQVGQAGLVLGIGMTLVTMTVFFFGIFYVLSVFYFAKDVENLLPLPLTSGQIVGAKFLVTLVYEYLTELVVFLPIIIGYGIAMQQGVGYYIAGVLIFLLMPVAPLSLASIIDMLIMSFTNIAKNKDRFKMFSALLGLFLALGINFAAQRIGQDFSDPEMLQRLVSQGDNSLLATMSKLFPTNKIAVLALVSEPITALINLGIFIVAMAMCFGAFYGLSGLLYFKGAVGINESAASRRKLRKEDFERETRIRGSFIATYLKELRLLVRNPGYFVNCVIMNFLFPFFLLIPFLAGGSDLSAKDMQDVSTVVMNPGAMFLAGAFITATNSIACSAISREGRLLYISKFLPIDPKVQLNAKLMTALVFGACASVILILVERFLFEFSLLHGLIGLALLLLSTVFTGVVGLLLDVFFPKLNWDNELKAVKQNLNVLFLILISVIAGGVLVAASLALKLDFVLGGVLIILLFAVIDGFLYATLMTLGAAAYSKLESAS